MLVRKGQPCRRAGPELRKQAIERTLLETLYPHRVWGLEGNMTQFRTLTNAGTLLTERVLIEEAKIRLSLLRAVDFQP